MIDSGFSDLQINILVIELVGAGSNTTTSTIEWAMIELLRNKGAMHKFQAELTSKFRENDIITESNISELPYLAAIVKETLRIHSPTPFLIPRRRAPETWRRICPGLGFARQEIHLILACLIHYFEWSIPNGEDPMQLDMEEKVWVLLYRKKSLYSLSLCNVYIFFVLHMQHVVPSLTNKNYTIMFQSYLIF
ncbi:(S)-N-methylcoclaurine 3'-hydroxylase isozyme 1-like isoform X2 [Solanum tuberosum]|uniref:(S)-N-methylcoclaurine 3'-hydroxylase isozyme 1-like isoform X2 n=1 Tax=Solanum tuberosum TaxID=4113 RepID=UPI00073A3C03|nr:PREDICTED: (S)-N-methylcoclaurine 3'-hydroxylase isozyme 1-like isoform X2 [Solanum tuberosum]